MPPWTPLVLASALYLWQAINYLVLGDRGTALAFFAYSLANVGFMWAIIDR